ncbi:MAG: helix-turn-helix transcriptional regulator [Candidatus Levybacteria bacterium]|nr:helix-turn-helix transcriptional regulator [Candidatus Levybacteria bacterium]
MSTATLGGLIKDYRIKKRLSQLEVSLKIGWKDSTRLSKIEQGRAGKPTRKTVDKIIAALNLTNQEKGEFLLTGSYLPTDKEIDQVIKSVCKQILTWPYAAYLIDFSWRLLLVNQHAIDLFGFPQTFLKEVRKANINLLEGTIRKFPNETFKGNYKENLKPIAPTLISQFKSEHLGKENEKWYKELINRFSTNPSFNKLWNTISADDYHEKLSEYEYVLKKWPNGKIVTHHVFESTLVSDKRFTVVLQLRET